MAGIMLARMSSTLEVLPAMAFALAFGCHAGAADELLLLLLLLDEPFPIPETGTKSALAFTFCVSTFIHFFTVSSS